MLLVLDGVSQQFGGVRALDRVSFAVASGDIHGLIGPNGAGKTTLINILAGLARPTGGSVCFGGQRLDGIPAHAVAARGIARTFQNIRLFPGMTCLENVMAGQHLTARRALLPRLLRLPSVRREEGDLRRAALARLSRVELQRRADTPASALSYGERRRLEIARALALEPRLLLLDEPVAGMRAAESENVAALLRSLAAEGMTVLLIEHNMRFVMGLCDMVTVLNFGRVVATGSPEAIAANPDVIEAYLGAGDEA